MVTARNVRFQRRKQSMPRFYYYFILSLKISSTSDKTLINDNLRLNMVIFLSKNLETVLAIRVSCLEINYFFNVYSWLQLTSILGRHFNFRMDNLFVYKYFNCVIIRDIKYSSHLCIHKFRQRSHSLLSSNLL